MARSQALSNERTAVSKIRIQEQRLID